MYILILMIYWYMVYDGDILIYGNILIYCGWQMSKCRFPELNFQSIFGITPILRSDHHSIAARSFIWVKWFTSPKAMCYTFGKCMGYTLSIPMVIHVWSLHSPQANVLPVTINEQHDRYGFVRFKTWALAIRAKHHFLSGSWVQVDATNLPPCLHQSVCKMLVNSATAFPNIAKMIPQSEVSHETYWTMALTWMAAVVNHVVLRPSFLHEFHGPRKPRNPNLLDKFICLISHDGSMVLVYMVCHGSHQYTPVMLAYIPAPWIRHGYIWKHMWP